MPVYMVERDLPGIEMEQLAAAQKAAIENNCVGQNRLGIAEMMARDRLDRGMVRHKIG